MTTAGGSGCLERPNTGGGGGHRRGADNATKPIIGGGQPQTDQLSRLTPANHVNDRNQELATSHNSNSNGNENNTNVNNNHNRNSNYIHNQEEDNFPSHHSDEVEDGIEDDNDTENESMEDEEEVLSEALLAVASAEEYAAKIIKLQQACLIPLKEDLADWLNKILNMSNITTENFMDKLDNGVIICRLAKIISLWCQQQLNTNKVHSTTTDSYNNPKRAHHHASPLPRPRFGRFATPIGNGPMRSTTSQSTNCLISVASTTSLNYNGNGYSYHSNQFLNNLIRMQQTKIWKDARGRTFYARDNVCNFIRWCKEFGVNQSVLFESDDLVLHANPRQVVLCLLDVARIAYVKYGFTEAPGLVKFEQEIDKVSAMKQVPTLDYCTGNKATAGFEYNNKPHNSDTTLNNSNHKKKPSSLTKNSPSISTGDPTDELIMRYCRHKQEEAARKRNEESEAAIKLSFMTTDSDKPDKESVEPIDECDANNGQQQQPLEQQQQQDHPQIIEADSLMPNIETDRDELAVTMSPSGISINMKHSDNKNLSENSLGNSLDSGQGPTESASTATSTRIAQNDERQVTSSSSIPTPIKRMNFSPSLISQRTEESSITNDDCEISSSRSSLFSNQDATPKRGYGRHITSDLDGKVMRIAKSYYGKGVTKDVTRLSEGKYKIADRIVFVRLLKGHRIMVRIGGGWDTLENFLFRHKSDPSQVIDVDNLLPLQ